MLHVKLLLAYVVGRKSEALLFRPIVGPNSFLLWRFDENVVASAAEPGAAVLYSYLTASGVSIRLVLDVHTLYHVRLTQYLFDREWRQHKIGARRPHFVPRQTNAVLI